MKPRYDHVIYGIDGKTISFYGDKEEGELTGVVWIGEEIGSKYRWKLDIDYVTGITTDLENQHIAIHYKDTKGKDKIQWAFIVGTIITYVDDYERQRPTT